jgi:hypothetical protein
MEDCKICFSKESNKTLPCTHTLCSDCCVRLNFPTCPFCRQNFVYTGDEIKQRIKLGLLSGYKQELSPGLAFRPEDWIERRIENRQLDRYIRIDEVVVHEPYSRVRKNMNRNRRRALSFDEVLERRKFIKEKKARHWDRKNSHLDKINWWENENYN